MSGPGIVPKGPPNLLAMAPRTPRGVPSQVTKSPPARSSMPVPMGSASSTELVTEVEVMGSVPPTAGERRQAVGWEVEAVYWLPFWNQRSD